MKVQVIPRFPAQVVGAPPVTVTSSEGIITIGLDSSTASAGRVFETRSAAIGTDLSAFAIGDVISTNAFAVMGDGGGAVYERVDVPDPSGVAYFTALDGSVWKLKGPIINILQFGAKADPTVNGTNDATPAITDAILFLNSNPTITTLVIGRGENYTLLGQLPEFTRNIDIYGTVGDGSAPSIINKRYIETSTPSRGILSFGKWMPKISHLQIIATSGSGGSAIEMVNPADTASIGNCYLEELRISTGVFCDFGLYIDGTANAVAPAGARNIFLDNVQILGANQWACKLSGVRNVFMANVTIDDAGGNPGGLWLTGTATVNSVDVNITGTIAILSISFSTEVLIYGIVENTTLDTTDNVQIHGYVAGSIVANIANVTNTRIVGRVTGTVQADWLPSNIVVPSGSTSTQLAQSVFDTKAAAQSYVVPAGVAYPTSIELRSTNFIGEESGGVYADTGSVPAHDHKVTIGAHIYTAIPAVPHSPASILELGLYNWTGANTDPLATDATPGLNAMIACAQNNGFADWFFPPGNYIFKTVPNWIENVPYFRVRGKSEAKTELYKSFPSIVGTNQGIIRARANGVDIMDLSMIGMAPSQIGGVGSGCLICYEATAAFPIGYGHMERLNLTSGAVSPQAFIWTNVFLNGAPNPAGIRAIAMNDVKLFGAEAAALLMDNVVAFTSKGPGTFTAGGKTGRIFISGSPGHISSYIDIDYAIISNGIQTANIQGALIKAGIFAGGAGDSIIHDAATSLGVVTVGTLQNLPLGTMGPGCFHIGGALTGGILLQGTAIPVDSGSNVIGYWRKYGDKTIEQSFFAPSLLTGVPKAFAFPIQFQVGNFFSIVATPAGGNATISVLSQTLNDVTLLASADTNAWVSVRGS